MSEPEGESSAGSQRCFMAMPIAVSEDVREQTRDPEHWNHVMEYLFEPAIREAGFEPWRPSSQGSTIIHQDIFTALAEADLVLADLSTHNPNVFFELGVRIGLNKPTVLVQQTGTRRPFDLSSTNILDYNPQVRLWNHAAEIAALATHIRSTVERSDGTNLMREVYTLHKKAEPSRFGGVATADQAAIEEMRLRLSMVEDRLKLRVPPLPNYEEDEEVHRLLRVLATPGDSLTTDFVAKHAVITASDDEISQILKHTREINKLGRMGWRIALRGHDGSAATLFGATDDL